jgi:hypothetical protein
MDILKVLAEHLDVGSTLLVLLYFVRYFTKIIAQKDGELSMLRQETEKRLIEAKEREVKNLTTILKSVSDIEDMAKSNNSRMFDHLRRIEDLIIQLIGK